MLYFERHFISHAWLSLIIALGATLFVTCTYAESVSRSNQPELELTAAEQAWLDAHPVIRVGIDKHFSPYEWLDEDGQYLGIAADHMKLLEQRLGVDFEFVRANNSWAEVLDAARKGEVDIVSCVVRTKERDTYLNFSKPYLSSVAVIISEQSRGYIGSLDRLSGKTVAIHKGHYTDEILQADYPDIRVIHTANIQQALQMVATGRADAFVGDATAAGYAMKQEGLLNLSFAGQIAYHSEFRVGVLHRHAELSSIIDKALNSITKAEYAAIYDHWHGLQIPPGIGLKKLAIYGSAGLFLILLFAYWNYRLRISKKAFRGSEEAHRQSEKRFKNLVDTTNGIVWEADAESFVFTYMSDNTERILGYSTAEWMQRNFWQEHIYDEDREWAIKFCAEQTTLKNNFDFEYRFVTKAGDIVWLKDIVSVVVERDKPRWLRGITLDVTEIKKADLLIKQSEQRFRELIESLPAIAVQGYDQDRKVVYWNDASTALYGYTREEVLGRKLEDLIIPDDMREKVIRDHQYWLKSGITIPAGELELKHKNGQLIPVFSSFVMLNKGLDKGEMFCIDISLAEQKRVTKELIYMANPRFPISPDF